MVQRPPHGCPEGSLICWPSTAPQAAGCSDDDRAVATCTPAVDSDRRQRCPPGRRSKTPACCKPASPPHTRYATRGPCLCGIRSRQRGVPRSSRLTPAHVDRDSFLGKSRQPCGATSTPATPRPSRGRAQSTSSVAPSSTHLQPRETRRRLACGADPRREAPAAATGGGPARPSAARSPPGAISHPCPGARARARRRSKHRRRAGGGRACQLERQGRYPCPPVPGPDFFLVGLDEARRELTDHAFVWPLFGGGSGVVTVTFPPGLAEGPAACGSRDNLCLDATWTGAVSRPAEFYFKAWDSDTCTAVPCVTCTCTCQCGKQGRQHGPGLLCYTTECSLQLDDDRPIGPLHGLGISPA